MGKTLLQWPDLSWQPWEPQVSWLYFLGLQVSGWGGGSSKYLRVAWIHFVCEWFSVAFFNDTNVDQTPGKHIPKNRSNSLWNFSVVMVFCWNILWTREFLQGSFFFFVMRFTIPGIWLVILWYRPCTAKLYIKVSIPRCPLKGNYLVIRKNQVALVVKNWPANAGDERDTCSIPGSEGPLKEGMASRSSILAWSIPWTEEPSRLQAIGLHGVKHDWTDLACMHREIIRIKKFIASYLFYYLMLVIIDIYWVYITQY